MRNMKPKQCGRTLGITLVFLLIFGWAQALAADENPLVGHERFQPGATIEGTGLAQVYDNNSQMVRLLPYTVIDGMAIHEGDMILGKASDFETQAGSGDPNVLHGAVHKDINLRWPGGIVPWRIDSGGYTEANRQAIIAGMNKMEELTGVRFMRWHGMSTEEREKYPDYIEFKNGGGCSSYIGKTGWSTNRQSSSFTIWKLFAYRDRHA